jgi:hypothetical protein
MAVLSPSRLSPQKIRQAVELAFLNIGTIIAARNRIITIIKEYYVL